MSSRKTRKLICVLLCLLISFSSANVMPYYAAADTKTDNKNEKITEEKGTEDTETLSEDEYEQIEINSVEEFIDFAEKCIYDSYSKNRKFILKADINLSGIGFEPVPVFAGVFDGKGYTISGLAIHHNSSDTGLFRVLEENAVIRNLDVSGNVMPSGTRKSIGGIVGINRGLIEGCTYDGIVQAAENTGGIAGYNESTGSIERCTNLAVITGNRMTGGIVGLNEGTIISCTNRGEVNSSSKTVEEDTQDLVSINLEMTPSTEKINDAGGIAGMSSGTVQGCVNYGTVGYQHTGYNMGGIVGRQNGCIYYCYNYGSLYGRKDAGGIVGQFEPYTLINYDQDTLDKIGKQADVLINTVDSLAKTARSMDDVNTGEIDTLSDSLKQLRDSTRGYKDYYKGDMREFSDNLGANLDNLKGAVEDIDINADNVLRANVKQMEKLIDEAKSIQNELVNSDNTPEEIAGLLGQLMAILGDIGLQSHTIVNDTAESADGDVLGLRQSVSDIADEADNLQALISDNKRDLRTDADSTDTDITSQLDNIYDLTDALRNNTKNSKEEIKNQLASFRKQIKDLKKIISDGIDEARDKIDNIGNDDENVYDDYSDDDDTSVSNGRVIGSINYGKISCDSNTGGIAGVMAFELSLDPESDIDVDGDWTLNMSRTARATIIDCVNRGIVVSKNNYAGGIAGKADMGALVNNQNYGDIEASDGDYAGGIAGSSNFVIRSNYNLSAVTGKNYVGGITGDGCNLYDNYVSAQISSDGGERLGILAGYADGEISGNIYVKGEIGAVDGITYDGQAEEYTYDEFVKIPEAPAAYQTMLISFYVEGQVIRTISCAYGGSVDDTQYPNVPEKDGCYYQWNKVDLSDVRRNITIDGEYMPWISTIASKESIPLILLESDFHPDTTVEIRETDITNAVGPVGYTVLKGYEYSIIKNEDSHNPGNLIVRILETEYKDKNVSAAVYKDGNYVLTDTKRDGSYLVFNMEKSGSFILVQEDINMKEYYAIGICAAILILIVILAVLHHKKRKKKTNIKQKIK